MRIEYEDEAPTQVVHEIEHIKLPGAAAEADKSKEEVWEKVSTKTAVEDPIEESDIAKPRAEDEEEPLPDRALVSSDLRDFLKKKDEAPDPLHEQAARLEAALNQIATPQEEQTFEQMMANKLEAIEARLARKELEEAQKREQEDYEKKVTDFRERVEGYVTDNEDLYPGINALGRQSQVFNELFRLAQEGREVSEIELTSHMERQLQKDYEKLRAVYGKSSKETKPSDTPKTRKALPTRDDGNEGKPFNPNEYRSLKEAQEALWSRLSRSAV